MLSIHKLFTTDETQPGSPVPTPSVLVTQATIPSDACKYSKALIVVNCVYAVDVIKIGEVFPLWSLGTLVQLVPSIWAYRVNHVT